MVAKILVTKYVIFRTLVSAPLNSAKILIFQPIVSRTCVSAPLDFGVWMIYDGKREIHDGTLLEVNDRVYFSLSYVGRQNTKSKTLLEGRLEPLPPPYNIRHPQT